jgi:hypothetical protein
MTLLDRITKEAESLSVKERRTALRLIKTLRSKSRTGAPKAPVAMAVIDKRKLHPALRAIARIWKDRTDLPTDTVEASRYLRKKMMRRGSGE